MNTWKNDQWWASSYNDLPAYRSGLNLPKRVEIHDATLRDGEQTPGIVFSVEEKVKIAKQLDAIGVDRIEAGMPAVSEADREAIKTIASLGLSARIYAFARAMRGDIDMAAECGADGVIIEIPVSDPKLSMQFPKWSKEDIISLSVDTVRYAREKGLEAVYFGYDTTRADFAFLEKLYSTLMKEARPDSIGIVDTMGCILPGAMKELVTKLKSMFDIKFEVHTHNDFGMATAVSFAAMEAGAEVIHVCMNGLGERTGNAPLEEIMAGMKVLYGMDVKYDLSLLNDFSRKLAGYSNFKLGRNKPIVGENIFVRESGIGVDLILNQPLAMFAMTPELLGKKASIVLGKKSGSASLVVKAEELGLNIAKEDMPDILQKVKQAGIQAKTTLDDETFIKIVKEHQQA